MTHNPHFVLIKSVADAERLITAIGSDPDSIEIMAPKAVFKVIRLDKVVLQDAIIIKQDMLSLGGEVAVPKDTFELHDQTGSILIMGTMKQLHELVGKLERHYPRLKTLAGELHQLLQDVH